MRMRILVNLRICRSGSGSGSGYVLVSGSEGKKASNNTVFITLLKLMKYFKISELVLIF
jgi:hypothetical protein